MSFFSKETIQEKEDMLLIFTCILMLVFALYLIVKYETLTTVLVSLAIIMFTGVIVMIFL